MRAVTIQNTAPTTTVSWTVDQDCAFLGVASTVSTVVSRDPSVTQLGFQAPSVAGATYNAIAMTNSGKPPDGMVPSPGIPLLQGEVIYVAFSAANSAIIYLEP